jgi:hypothetical protein
MDITMTKEDRVRARAYEIFKTQGSSPGKDLDHWLQAEKEMSQELKQEPKKDNVRKQPQIRNNLYK